MKKVFPKEIEKYRIAGNGFNGAFIISIRLKKLKVICSDGGGWDHVSVSHPARVPTWKEMCFIKDLFFEPEETVIQYHPPHSKYVNVCKNALHLWRKQNHEYELPPLWMV